MKILTINCGSSSIKYQLFNLPRTKTLAKGIAEKIGKEDSLITHYKGDKVFKVREKLDDYFGAVDRIAGLLSDPKCGAIKDKSQIAAVGHRVVHGGEEFKASVKIDSEVLKKIKDYAKLAPLHNPPAYNGICASMKIFENAPQVAVFDTAFHQTMPAQAYIYGVPYSWYEKYCVRRYGFHGTSHRYVAHAAAKLIGRPLSRLKIITCHLGNGCSITAVNHGHSVDTSMGFTPLEGLLMGTRSGDIDPALIGYIMEKEKVGIEKVEEILNRKSGLLGISGVSNDMRDLIAHAKNGNKRAQLAIDIFLYRVKKYIGAYMAVMNGVDVIVFTAGIGENVGTIKNRIVHQLNNVLKKKTKVLTIHTEEERLIAFDTYDLIKG